MSNAFLFGSELKALACHPCWNPHLSRSSLSLFLQYLPFIPHSIYDEIQKLLPGHYVTYSYQKRSLTPPQPYWNLKDRIRQSLDNPFQTSTSTLIDQLHNKLLSSVKSQIVCDIPVGSFLSGGIDSSLITSLMQSVSPKPINTFSIGFNESSYNESCYAKNIGLYLGIIC